MTEKLKIAKSPAEIIASLPENFYSLNVKAIESLLDARGDEAEVREAFSSQAKEQINAFEKELIALLEKYPTLNIMGIMSIPYPMGMTTREFRAIEGEKGQLCNMVYRLRQQADTLDDTLNGSHRPSPFSALFGH